MVTNDKLSYSQRVSFSIKWAKNSNSYNDRASSKYNGKGYLPCHNIKHFKLTLTLSQTRPGFTCLQLKSFENTVGKGEIDRDEHFLLFQQFFLPIWRTFCHFHHILNCRLQTLSVWKSLNLSFGKGLR